MALPLFNPLHHTWAISAPARGPNGYFGLKLPLCRGEDYFAYFELAKIASKSGKRLNPKAILSFLGDVGVKKWSQKFGLGTQSAILGHLKKGTFGKSAQIWNKKSALWVPKWKFWDHFLTPTSPKNDRIAFCFKRFPLLDAILANSKMEK